MANSKARAEDRIAKLNDIIKSKGILKSETFAIKSGYDSDQDMTDFKFSVGDIIKYE